jgi:hypothetical protein
MRQNVSLVSGANAGLGYVHRDTRTLRSGAEPIELADQDFDSYINSRKAEQRRAMAGASLYSGLDPHTGKPFPVKQ